ncbi:MAG: hypothetical protein ABJE95_36025 [Byssovorax sp.]
MANDTPSDTVLDEAPTRAIKLLGALSTNRAIRAAFARRGYTQVVHEHGWQLALKASGYRRTTPIVFDSPEATSAIATIDSWDEPTFRVARAALAGEFPEQCQLVFQDLQPQTGIAAVVSVTTFLNRLDVLENDKDRKATRKVDQAALAKLAARGITPAERERMRKLLAVAQRSSAEAPMDAASAVDPAIEAAELRAAKVAVYAWYAEWREVAKADIKRRDHLIQLGVAQRKAPKKAEVAPVGK